MAADTSTRPATLLGVADPLVGYCVDRACLTFGRALEAAARDAAERGKGDDRARQARATRVADRWLASADPADARPTAGRFRDPFAEGLVG